MDKKRPHQVGYLCFDRRALPHATLRKINYILKYSGGEMLPKRLAALVVLIIVLISTASAQRNEVSATLGRVFVSSQGIKGATFFNPNVHFGNGLTIGGNYTRLLRTYGIFGISGEVPFAYSF